ncbi:MAG: exopolyphosphatase [Pseudomonadota bacterium]
MYTTPPEIVAAVDLGSNSFHMIVASLRNGEVSTVDRIKEMVRLAAGLDKKQYLTEEALQRAMECLGRFGERLRDMPPGSVRAVGTNTLRMARNAEEFLLLAEEALGHPIDIISGIEEARLIYQGVAHSLATDDGKRRLVMDIGGGSTEFIIGIGNTPKIKESLRMGCVSMSTAHFKDGKITPKRFNNAVLSARQKLEPFQLDFNKNKWGEAVGASGTLRAVCKVLQATGWSKSGITLGGLKKLADCMLEAGHVDKLELPELSIERKPVFPGGVAVLYASFLSLDIDFMDVSDGALREGLLHDLLGRIYDDDIRIRTANTLVERYHVNTDHSARIIKTLRHLLKQSENTLRIDRETAAQWLQWAAELHEIGLDIAHSQYHEHGAYIIKHADMAGFSQQDQELLSALVRVHRRKFSRKRFKNLMPPWNKTAPKLAVLLRLSVLLHRSRHPKPLPELKLDFSGNTIDLTFPEKWLEDHPLTVADLEQEAKYLNAGYFKLCYR